MVSEDVLAAKEAILSTIKSGYAGGMKSTPPYVLITN